MKIPVLVVVRGRRGCAPSWQRRSRSARGASASFRCDRHRDRHWHIGDGRIGPAGFRALLAHEAVVGKTVILEMPGEEEDDVRNLTAIRALATEVTGCRLPKERSDATLSKSASRDAVSSTELCPQLVVAPPDFARYRARRRRSSRSSPPARPLLSLDEAYVTLPTDGLDAAIAYARSADG